MAWRPIWALMMAAMMLPLGDAHGLAVRQDRATQPHGENRRNGSRLSRRLGGGGPARVWAGVARRCRCAGPRRGHHLAPMARPGPARHDPDDELIPPLLHRRAAWMKLPHFEYEAPGTVSEAVELLAEHQDEASVLAGGQSLIPLLALRLAHPAVLIDINGVDELSGVSAADGWVAIGAMTREYIAEESETVAGTVPLLAAALPLIGHEAIRSRGTIGGSLAHADPAAELPAVARALDAEFVVRGQSGERVVPAAEWFEGFLTTSRRPDELLVEVRFPTAERGTGISFQEVARRHGDFAIVGLAASLTLSDGAISDARLAFSGVSDVPVRAVGAEDLLVGEGPSPELFDEAARRAADEIDPPADLHGSSDYRRKVAAALVRRGLRAAADNAYERQ